MREVAQYDDADAMSSGRVTICLDQLRMCGDALRSTAACRRETTRASHRVKRLTDALR